MDDFGRLVVALKGAALGGTKLGAMVIKELSEPQDLTWTEVTDLTDEWIKEARTRAEAAATEKTRLKWLAVEDAALVVRYRVFDVAYDKVLTGALDAAQLSAAQ